MAGFAYRALTRFLLTATVNCLTVNVSENDGTSSVRENVCNNFFLNVKIHLFWIWKKKC